MSGRPSRERGRQLLAPVHGRPECCGPAALSAATGRPADSWPDVAMDLADVAAALADFAPEPLAPDAFVVGRLLLAFCAPSLPPDEWPLPDPSGRYVPGAR